MNQQPGSQGSEKHPNRAAKRKKQRWPKGFTTSRGITFALQSPRKRRGRDKWAGKLFKEIMAENFPNWGSKQLSRLRKGRKFQIRTQTDPNQNTLQLKYQKLRISQKFLKISGEKQCYVQGNPIKWSADFSSESLKVRRMGHDIFKVTERKISNKEYSAMLSFGIEGEIS